MSQLLLLDLDDQAFWHSTQLRFITHPMETDNVLVVLPDVSSFSLFGVCSILYLSLFISLVTGFLSFVSVTANILGVLSIHLTFTNCKQLFFLNFINMLCVNDWCFQYEFEHKYMFVGNILYVCLLTFCFILKPCFPYVSAACPFLCFFPTMSDLSSPQ